MRRTAMTLAITVLAICGAGALFADAPADRAETTYVTGWGRPRDGIQVGLRYASDQRIVRPGKATRVELVIRNLTSKQIEIRHFTGTAYRYSVEKTVVTASEQQMGRAVVGRNVTLRPRESFVFGSFLIGHVRKETETAFDGLILFDDLTFATHPLLLSPGIYQVGCESLMLRQNATDPELTTGYFDIELAQSE